MSHWEYLMESANISDSVVASMMVGAVDQETIASLWSSFITVQSTPGDTLRDFNTPGYTLPEILPKTIAFPGENIPDADYSVLSKLGEGGMGVVFEARQNHLDRTVALKMIRPGRAGDPMARACFFYEAVITAGLEHPGIVSVLEFGRDQAGRDFYVMKKATGVPWSRVIREKTLEENLAIFDRVADVAAYAHTRGILHRDLKPANVLLGDFGEIWLGDWGVAIARGADGTYRHAHPGGTPQYMPPEMARGDVGNLGPCSDVYLLGAILLEMVTGKPPHSADTAPNALLDAAANVVLVNSDHPLISVIRRSLAESPAARYASVDELRHAIAECLSMDRCRAHMLVAEGLYKEAVRNGDYGLFQKAIAEYDFALDVCPGNSQAQKARSQTRVAYSRRALANGEYDVALTVIEPEIVNSTKAAILANTITKQKERDNQRGRRTRVFIATLLVVVLSGAGGIIYVYRANRDDLVLVASAMRTSREQIQQARERSLLSGILNEVRMLSVAVMHAMASDPRGGGELTSRYEEMQQILHRCQDEFRFPDQTDVARYDAACRYVLEQYPRLAELMSEMTSIDASISVQRRQSPVPELARQFAKFSEFVEAYRKKVA